jgi:hypothetical protein
MRAALTVTLLALILAFALPPKASALDSALVGVWQHNNLTIEFYADGTFLADDGSNPMKGAWQAEGGKLTIMLTPPGGGTEQSATCDYRIEADTLVLSGGGPGCDNVALVRVVAVQPVDPDRPLLGKWQYEDGTVEFHADGTLTFASRQQQINGTWTLDGGQITLVLTGPDGTTQTATCDFAIEGNTLTIAGDGQSCGKTVFQRIS